MGKVGSVIFLCAIGLLFDICVSQQDICSGGDISGENDLNFADLVGKIWYIHLILDDTGTFGRDAKLLFEFDQTGENILAYYVGRSVKTGQCETVLFQDVQLVMNRPCLSIKQIFPATNQPAAEFIATFIDRTKTRLLFYVCLDFDETTQICNTAAAFGATTRRFFQRREKAAFEAKIEAFGRPLPPGGLPNVDRPATNNCEDPIANALGIRRTQKRRRY